MRKNTPQLVRNQLASEDVEEINEFLPYILFMFVPKEKFTSQSVMAI